MKGFVALARKALSIVTFVPVSLCVCVSIVMLHKNVEAANVDFFVERFFGLLCLNCCAKDLAENKNIL